MVALHIAGRGNIIADALPRFAIKATGGDPYPDRELRPRLPATVLGHCGAMDADMMSGDKGVNAWRARFSSPAKSAFESPLPGGQLRRLPRVGVIDPTLRRIVQSLKGAW